MEYKVKKTNYFEKWFQKRTPEDIARIGARLNRIKNGNFGDCKPISGKIYELRFRYGSGFRIYYKKEGLNIILLLIGGNKSSQNEGIDQAKKISKKIEEANYEH